METLEYEIFHTNFRRLVSIVKPQLGEISRKAFAKKLITSQILSDIENHKDDQDVEASKLLSDVSSKIREQRENFFVFVAILEETPICSSFAKELKAKVERSSSSHEIGHGFQENSRNQSSCPVNTGVVECLVTGEFTI